MDKIGNRMSVQTAKRMMVMDNNNLIRWAYDYYIKADSPVSDGEYTRIEHRLAKLERDYGFRLKNSRTHQVGAPTAVEVNALHMNIDKYVWVVTEGTDSIDMFECLEHDDHDFEILYRSMINFGGRANPKVKDKIDFLWKLSNGYLRVRVGTVTKRTVSFHPKRAVLDYQFPTLDKVSQNDLLLIKMPKLLSVAEKVIAKKVGA